MIAVTGGNGFLGRHLLSALQFQKIDFLALLRSPRPDADIPKIKQRVVDFSQISKLTAALEGTDQVLHLAGKINGRLEELREANPVLMQRLVEASCQAGVRKIIYTSSVAAHIRKGPYGETKWEAEEVLKTSGIPFLIFRPALIYGAGDTKNVATIEQMLKKFPVVPLLGGGRFLIQPAYVEDIVSVLVRALESPLENRIYSLAGPAQISLKEMMELLQVSLGRKVWLVPFPLKPVQVLAHIWALLFPNSRLPVKQIMELDKHEAFDIREAQKDFGFSPRPFQEGLHAMRASEPLCVG